MFATTTLLTEVAKRDRNSTEGALNITFEAGIETEGL
jgi:hypothetical protein